MLFKFTFALFALTCLVTSLQADTEGIFTYTHDTWTDEIRIIDCETTASGKIVIPSEINNLPVTKIDRNAFEDCTNITHIVIPDSITIIFDFAFQNCSSLTTATIPASVTRINNYVFRNCTQLTSVFFKGNAPTNFGHDVFTNTDAGFIVHYLSSNTGFTSGTWEGYSSEAYQEKFSFSVIGDAVEAIQITDYPTTELGAVTIPETIVGKPVTIIGDEAFGGCNQLTQIKLPESIKKIENAAFLDCFALRTMTFPDGDLVLGHEIFEACSSMTSVFFSGYSPRIESDTFDSISNDFKVHFIDGAQGFDPQDPDYDPRWNNYTMVPYTQDFSFEVENEEITITAYPRSATGVLDIPETIVGKPVTIIGREAFRNCSSLTEINFPSSLIGIEYLAFADCTGASKFNFPEGLMSIGTEAFKGCTSLKTFTVPESVIIIKFGAFSGCTNFESIFFEGNSPTIENNVFLNVSSQFEVYHRENMLGFTAPWNGYDPYEEDSGNFEFRVVNEEIEITGYPKTYSGAISLWSTIVGKPVTSIAPRAFENCNSLTIMELPRGIHTIKEEAFKGCSQLVTFTIPANTTQIGNEAFANCTKLASVFFDSDAPSLGTDVFLNTLAGFKIYRRADATGYSSPWHGHITHVDSYAYPFYIKSEGVVIGEYPKSIAGMVTIPSEIVGKPVTWIGYNSFKACTELTEVILPDTLQYIATGAFRDCFNLARITLPDSLKRISKSSFYNCNELKSVSIPASVTKIDSQAFYSCDQLISVFFQGNEPDMAGSEQFRFCHFNFKVYFKSGMSGFTTPTWEGHPSEAYDGPFVFFIHDETITITDCDNAVTGRLNIPDEIVGKPVVEIKSNAFSSCGASKISIPPNVETIAPSAFNACPELHEIIVHLNNLNYSSNHGILYNKDKSQLIRFPEGNLTQDVLVQDGVTQIGSQAFLNVSHLVTLTLPASVNAISNKAFKNCTHFKTALFRGDAPTTVGDGIFLQVSSAFKIYYYVNKSGFSSTWQDKPAESINTLYTFQIYLSEIYISGFPSHITGTEIIPSEFIGLPVVGIQAYAFKDSELNNITIPSSINTISGRAFMNCDSITQMHIPASVSNMQSSPFIGCSQLNVITVDPANPNFMSAEGVLFNKLQTTLVCYPSHRAGSSYQVPESVETIGYSSFYECYQLTSMVFPDSLRTIQQSAFLSCVNLKRLHIPENVTSIELFAFARCSSLKRAVFYGDGDTQNSQLITSRVFEEGSSDFRIYYFSDHSGFDSPEWHGYSATEIDLALYPLAIWLLRADLEFDADLNDDVSGDGIPLLMNYALNQWPHFQLTAFMPKAKRTGNTLSMKHYASKEGITYQVQVSPDLTPGSWTTAGISLGPINENGYQTATLTTNGTQMFMRIHVQLTPGQ